MQSDGGGDPNDPLTKRTVAKVSGWGVYCQASFDFMCLLACPAPCVDALHARRSILSPSSVVSYCLPYCLPMSTTRLSLLPNHRHPKFEDFESYSNSIAGADGGGGESKLKNGGEGVADPAPRYVRCTSANITRWVKLMPPNGSIPFNKFYFCPT